MIRFANEKDIPEITKMWREIFEEDKEVCDWFFGEIFENAPAPIYEKDGEIASSLFLLPCSFGENKGLCVYCAMTKSDFRGKGLMKELLEFSYDYVKKEKLSFLFLVPAEESLFSYYGKCGFKEFGTSKIKLTEVETYPCTDEEYIEKRNENLGNTKRLVFPDSIIKYWLKTCRHYGGEVLSSGLVFPEKGEVIIRDLTGDGISEYVKNKYPNRKISVESKTGMIKTDLTLENDYYIGITLE